MKATSIPRRTHQTLAAVAALILTGVSSAHAGLESAAAWNALSPNLPPDARRAHAAIYDSIGDRMVVFGGSTQSVPASPETRLLTFGSSPSWSALNLNPHPSGRYGESAIFDPVRRRMIIFGGNDGAQLVNDVWALSLSGTLAWTHLAPSGTPPLGRYGHVAIYDPVRDRMITYGGMAPNVRNDTWALSLSGTPAWSQISAGTAPARQGHVAIYDPVLDRMLVFGGATVNAEKNDVWALDFSGTPAWVALAPTGRAPAAREGASGVYDRARGRWIVFGGVSNNPAAYYNDTWELDLNGAPSWAPFSIGLATIPEARYQHSAIFDALRDRMVVFAGVAEQSGIVNDTWEFGAATPLGLGPGGSASLRLGPAFPNPATGGASFEFALPEADVAALTVQDLAGRVVRMLVKGRTSAGVHTARWDRRTESGTLAPPGVYFAVLSTRHARLASKLVVLD